MSAFPFLRFIALVITFALAPAHAQCVDWTRPLPGPRTGDAVAFDSARSLVVLFGGVALDGALNETWTWNGSAWSLLNTPAPPARSNHAMAFDAARAQTVLYGGQNLDAVFTTTWLFNGSTWSERVVPGPGRRLGHAMAYDSHRQRVVLFGGYIDDGINNILNNETWEWDGAAWIRRSPENAPLPRAFHAMAYDSHRQRVVMFGGEIDPGDNTPIPAGDLWEFDGTNWIQRPVFIPDARVRHSMAYHPGLRRTIVFGGFGGDAIERIPLADTWAWNGQAEGSWTRLATGFPSPRPSALLVFDAARSTLLLSGRADAPTFSQELFSFSPGVSAWQQRIFTPSLRSGHAMTFNTSANSVLLFGGGAGSALLGDTWSFDSGVWTPHTSAASPTPRQFHTLAFDSLRARAVLFGGQISATAAAADTWTFDGSAWTQLAPATSPTARLRHALAFDSARGVAVLLGGLASPASATPLADHWEFNGSTWTRRQITLPPARSAHAMAFDSRRARLVLFGGRSNSTTVLDDTWEFNGSVWTRITTPASPPARSDHTLAFDAARGRIVLFGGERPGALLNDSWEFDGLTWTQTITGEPAPRENHAMTFDAARSRIVVFGGLLNTIARSADTFDLVAPGAASITSQPQDRVAPPNAVVSFHCSASGSGISYRWRKDGVPLTNSARITGATSRTLTISGLTFADAGLYDAVATNTCGSVISRAARLTVPACRADLNGDGLVDVDDFFAFLTAYANGLPAADFNADNQVDATDFFAYLTAYANAC